MPVRYGARLKQLAHVLIPLASRAVHTRLLELAVEEGAGMRDGLKVVAEKIEEVLRREGVPDVDGLMVEVSGSFDRFTAAIDAAKQAGDTIRGVQH